MKYTLKKTIAFLLTLMMVINMMPSFSFAGDDVGEITRAPAGESFSATIALYDDVIIPANTYVIAFSQGQSIASAVLSGQTNGATLQFYKLDDGEQIPLHEEYGFMIVEAESEPSTDWNGLTQEDIEEVSKSYMGTDHRLGSYFYEWEKRS